MLVGGGVGRCAGSKGDGARFRGLEMLFRREGVAFVLSSGDKCLLFEGFDGPGSGLLIVAQSIAVTKSWNPDTPGAAKTQTHPNSSNPSSTSSL